MLAYLGEFAAGFCIMFFIFDTDKPIKERLIFSVIGGLITTGAFNAIF